MNKNILLKNLGVKDYKETWDYQTGLLQEIVDVKISNRKNNESIETKNHFLFVEHPHVYTLGKSGDLDNLLLNEKQLKDNTQEVLNAMEKSQTGIDSQNTLTDSVTVAMNEMATTIDEVSRNVKLTSGEVVELEQLSVQSMESASESSSLMDELITQLDDVSNSLGQLNKETASIDTVVNVIEGIAEQTNLLALNAAIEAARAGEQGRGFAVVADEVRTLASRTQESTEEIQSVIEQLQKTARTITVVMDQGQVKAKESVSKAAETGESLLNITEGVETIMQMNMHIASATEQQQQTSSAIQHSVDEIRGSAENTAEGLAHLADVTQQLVSVSSRLGSIASQFKV